MRHRHGSIETYLSGGTNVSVTYLYIPPPKGGGADHCQIESVIDRNTNQPIEPHTMDMMELELECRQAGRQQIYR